MWRYSKLIHFARRLFILLIVLLFIAFIVLTYVARDAVPQQLTFAEFGKSTDVLYLSKTTDYYKNKTVIDHYFAINLKKTVTLLDKIEVQSLPETGNFYFAYGSDKGRDMFVDDQGRIYITVSPTEIRNKSQKGWLWWRLDSGRSSQIYYRSAPDPEMVELVKTIRTETGVAQ
jgi:hypothetical protein